MWLQVEQIMVKTIEIGTLDEALHLLKEQESVQEIDRYRSPFYYRGMPDSRFRLETTLERNCKTLKKELEPALLRSFTKFAVNDDPRIAESVWRQLIIGRHHGLPTRLLDWSHSPLIALHFATSGEGFETLDRHDGVIWRIDRRELYSLLPDKYRAVLDREQAFVYTVDMLNEVVADLNQYDEDMGTGAMVLVEPPSMDTRIINQYGNFTVIPSSMNDVEDFFEDHTENTVRYIIKAEIRWRIRDMLDQLNINERLVYPGLDGLSESLARHYFVR